MNSVRRIAVLSTGRQDFGILRSTIVALRSDPRVEAVLWVGGMHLSVEHGRTVDILEREGFRVGVFLDFLRAGASVTEVAAQALAMVGEELSRVRPSAIVLVGDRTETAAAGLAAAMLGVPIAHIHGGEETEGAVDNALRHALTKLSHIHFVAHEMYGRRVRQMGEHAASVHIVGPPSLDGMHSLVLPERAELERALGLELRDPVVVVTMHPTTLSADRPTAEVEAVTTAIEQVPATYLVTEPNADAGGDEIREYLHRWAAGRERVRVVSALGERRYFGLLKVASAMLGNSSSGLIEAPAFGLPVINVGDRQKGRIRSEHVRDTAAQAAPIVESLRWALAPTRRAMLASSPQPFPPGPAGERIAEVLATVALPSPARKVFVDWSQTR